MQKKITGAITALAVVLTVGIVALGGSANAADEPCVPQAAWTEVITPAVPATPGTPAIPATPGTPEVPAVPAIAAQHYSWTGGPIDEDVIPPVPPGGSWQANTTQEPHDNGNGDRVTWLGTVGVGLHFTGPPGNANWFYFQPAVPGTPAVPAVPGTPEVPAVPGTPAVPAVTVDHPAVTCPPTPTDEPTPVTPTVTPTETLTETPTVTPTTPVTPTETPEEPETTPEVPEEEAEEPTKPTKEVQVTQCVNGVFVTTLDGEVIAESGSCDSTSVARKIAVPAVEEGL